MKGLPQSEFRPQRNRQITETLAHKTDAHTHTQNRHTKTNTNKESTPHMHKHTHAGGCGDRANRERRQQFNRAFQSKALREIHHRNRTNRSNNQSRRSPQLPVRATSLHQPMKTQNAGRTEFQDIIPQSRNCHSPSPITKFHRCNTVSTLHKFETPEVICSCQSSSVLLHVIHNHSTAMKVGEPRRANTFRQSRAPHNQN